METKNKISLLIIGLVIIPTLAYSQPVGQDYKEFGIALDYFIAKKRGNSVAIFKSYKRHQDYKVNREKNNFFYVNTTEHIQYENDSIYFSIRAYIDHHTSFVLKDEAEKYNPDCIDI